MHEAQHLVRSLVPARDHAAPRRKPGPLERREDHPDPLRALGVPTVRVRVPLEPRVVQQPGTLALALALGEIGRSPPLPKRRVQILHAERVGGDERGEHHRQERASGSFGPRGGCGHASGVAVHAIPEQQCLGSCGGGLGHRSHSQALNLQGSKHTPTYSKTNTNLPHHKMPEHTTFGIW
eukprot:scaffold20333_cov64-Phaeocystis_antarctica.AAC.3